MPNTIAKKHAPINPSSVQALKRQTQAERKGGIFAHFRVCDYDKPTDCTRLPDLYSVYQVNTAPIKKARFPWQRTCYDAPPPFVSQPRAGQIFRQSVLRQDDDRWVGISDDYQFGEPPDNTTSMTLREFESFCYEFHDYLNRPKGTEAFSTERSDPIFVQPTISTNQFVVAVTTASALTGLGGFLGLMALYLIWCYCRMKGEKKDDAIKLLPPTEKKEVLI